MASYPQYGRAAMNQMLSSSLGRLNVDVMGSNGDFDDAQSVAYSSQSPLFGTLFYSPVDPDLSSPFTSQPDAQLLNNSSQELYDQPEAQHFEINSQESYIFPSDFTLDTNYIPIANSLNSVHNGDYGFGDQLFHMARESQAHSPLIEVTAPGTMIPGALERDFVNRTDNIILLQPAAELKSIPLDLFSKVGDNGFNVQQPVVQGYMDGVVAVRYGIAVLCDSSDRLPPSEADLLDFLRHMLAKQNVDDGSQPQLLEASGPDRPLKEEYLLMMLHRYSIRANRHYNLGIIRPLAEHSSTFGGPRTYTVSLSGPQTDGAKTVWVYEDNGIWYPMCPDNFQPAERINTFRPAETLYADAPAFSNYRGRSVSNPTLQTTNFLHPRSCSPTHPQQYTPSESGLSDISSYTTPSQQTASYTSDYHPRASSLSFPCPSISNLSLAVPSPAMPTPSLSGHGTRVLSAMAQKCKSCGKTFNHYSELQHHSRNHKERTLCCTVCCRTFIWRKDLVRHEKTHRGPKGERCEHRCDKTGCGKSYTRLDNLRRHVNNEHKAGQSGSNVSVAGSVEVGGARSRAGSARASG